jgi:hypothetical protein
MKVTLSDITLLAHASLGVLGCLAAIWVFFEALHASGANSSRLRIAAMTTALSMAAAWVLGGYWYVRFYPAEKALILSGPWPLAHNFFMETKEHLFFVTAILAFCFRSRPWISYTFAPRAVGWSSLSRFLLSLPVWHWKARAP